jgi:aryl-alcohol dehydrogenase-like predicted oxidoreductase
MDRYRELGGNFLDTADVYGPYNSEKIGILSAIRSKKSFLTFTLVGSWIKKNDVRKEMIIATKGNLRVK